jgi:hypothetical protein
LRDARKNRCLIWYTSRETRTIPPPSHYRRALPAADSQSRNAVSLRLGSCVLTPSPVCARSLNNLHGDYTHHRTRRAPA